MIQSKKKCIWSNHPALKVKNILTMSINSIRCSMGLSKPHEHGMNALRTFFIENGFIIGKADFTLFTRKMDKDLFVCQICVDDIIFSSTNKLFCDEFSKIMMSMFKMSMMMVLTFFLGFRIKQAKEGIFISQMRYTRDTLKKFGMDKANLIKTLMGTNGHLDLDLRGTSVDQNVYHFMIRYLLYLCASRPHIMLSVCMGARF
jgi:hypothetical protein